MKLAECCKTDVSYIGQIEMGIRFPSINLIEKIAKALKIDAYKLFMDDSSLKLRELEELKEKEAFLASLPPKIRNELIKQLTIAITTCIKDLGSSGSMEEK